MPIISPVGLVVLLSGARYTVTINQVLIDGTSLATRRGGQSVRMKGGLVAAGKKAWVEGGQIIGEAPDLPSRRCLCD